MTVQNLPQDSMINGGKKTLHIHLKITEWPRGTAVIPANKALHILHRRQRTFTRTTGEGPGNKAFFPVRRHVVVDQIAHDTVAKMSRNNLAIFRLCNPKKMFDLLGL